MLFGGHWFIVRPEDYSLSVTDDDSICSLCIDDNAYIYDEFVLGDAFMRGWYSIHDNDSTPPRMGFAPISGGTREKL